MRRPRNNQALAAGLLIAVMAGTLLARRLSGPLVTTAAAARRMAAGERTVHLEPAGVTEVRAVGAAINTLDQALLASEGRQREFLLSISHEIRTPLTALRGYAEALEDGLIPPQDIATVGQTLAAETDRLDGFVRDLLALARLEADDFALDIQPVGPGGKGLVGSGEPGVGSGRGGNGSGSRCGGRVMSCSLDWSEYGLSMAVQDTSTYGQENSVW